MTIYVETELDLQDFREQQCWSEKARETIDIIIENDKELDFEYFVENEYYDNDLTDGALVDFLEDEREYIFEELGIIEEDEEE